MVESVAIAKKDDPSTKDPSITSYSICSSLVRVKLELLMWGWTYQLFLGTFIQYHSSLNGGVKDLP